MCWKCGDKYFPGHVCKQKQINAMAAAEDQAILEAVEEEGTGGEGNSDNQIEEEIMDKAISLNALSGTEVPNTIKLRGKSKKNSITILLELMEHPQLPRHRNS